MGRVPGSAAHAALLDTIRAVPHDRLLIESDADTYAPTTRHTAAPGCSWMQSGCVGSAACLHSRPPPLPSLATLAFTDRAPRCRCETAAVAMQLALQLVSTSRGWSLERTAATTAANGLRFLHARAPLELEQELEQELGHELEQARQREALRARELEQAPSRERELAPARAASTLLVPPGPHAAASGSPSISDAISDAVFDAVSGELARSRSKSHREGRSRLERFLEGNLEGDLEGCRACDYVPDVLDVTAALGVRIDVNIWVLTGETCRLVLEFVDNALGCAATQRVW